MIERPATAPPTVSVVMPTYNRRASLERTVRAALADPEAMEIIVVVDGSHDGSYELIQALAREDARVRPLMIENSGEMGARQAGVEAARGDLVLILDDDVLASPQLAAGHARQHAGSPGLVVQGYMPVRLPERRTPHNFATFLYAAEYEAACRDYEADQGRLLRHLWAGNVSLRREDCLAVGLAVEPPRERPPDREFGLRCLEHGLRGRFARELGSEHLHERTPSAFLREARQQGRATVQVHALHAALLGPLDPAQFTANLPAAARALVVFARRPRAAGALQRVLAAAIMATGRARAYPVQTALARLARRIAIQSGALSALHPPG